MILHYRNKKEKKKKAEIQKITQTIYFLIVSVKHV